MTRRVLVLVIGAAGLLGAGQVAAQTRTTATPVVPAPHPTGRVSFFSNASRMQTDEGLGAGLGELTSAFAFRLDETDGDGVEYGIDARHSTYTDAARPDRLSIYEAFAGARVADGRVRLLGGQLWMNDLGSLGSVAGGAVEWRQRRSAPTGSRIRAGAFGGLEPNVLQAGYAPNVRKMGGYLTYEGTGSRRHTVGYVRVKNADLVERSVITATQYVPVGNTFFLYQAMEYDLQPPAGRAEKGLTYFFTTARVMASRRVEVQGTHSRGHSIDVRGLSDAIVSGRAVAESTVEGLLYESTGGRVTVEAARRVRVYAGYTSDKNSRDAARTGRVLVGGYASNVANQGFDLAASDTIIDRPTGRYQSRYVSLGRQIGRRVYTSADYTTSLSIIRYSRTDGVTVETHPHTSRISGSATINLGGAVSLLLTGERSRDDSSHEFRVLAGITFRMR
jgi:hypothetical protein